MKWIRWCNSGYYLTRSGQGELSHGIAGQLIDCEKVIEWREIESGTLDVESGKLRLVLKPVQSLKDAWNDFKANFPHLTDGELVVAKNMQSAIEREVAKSSLLVDEFLDAAIERNKNGSEFDLRWFFGDPSILVEEGSMRLYEAFHALLNEREAAK